MNPIIDIIKKLSRAPLLFVLCALCLLCARNASAQVTTAVKPRQYVLLNSQSVSNTQYLGTNVNQPSVTLGCTNVYTNVPTFIPFGGSSHPIGLTLQIVNSNKFAASSNIVVTVYPAYDTGGSTGIGSAVGTNYCPVPIFVWTVSYTTNLFVSTNIPSALWEPATSLGITVTNAATVTTGGAPSNVLVTLTASVAP